MEKGTTTKTIMQKNDRIGRLEWKWFPGRPSVIDRV